jgi:hypothetical protein
MGSSRAALNDEDHRPHDVFIADFVLFVGLVQLHLRFDILVADLEARLEASAHQIGPGDLRPQAALERIGAGAAGREHLRELVGVQAHAGGDEPIGIVDLIVWDFEAVALGLNDFQDLVDDAVHYLLA